MTRLAALLLTFACVASCAAPLTEIPPRKTFPCRATEAKSEPPTRARRPFRFLTVEDEAWTALHEAAHALTALRLFGTGAVLSASIEVDGTRGRVEFHSCLQPKHIRTIDDAVRRIAVSLAGVVAEREVLGIRSAIGVGDREEATADAIEIVTKFGMSGRGERSIKRSHADFNPALRAQVNREVEQVLARAETLAHAVITRHRVALLRLRTAILIHRTLRAEDVVRIVGAEALGQ